MGLATMSSPGFIDRKKITHKEIIAEDLLNQEGTSVKPSELIIVYPISESRNYRLDIGKLCFLDRAQVNSRRSLVRPQSFCTRRESAIASRIYDLAALSSNVLSYTLNFLDWIDGSKRGWDIESYEDMKEAYFYYTNSLIDRTRQSNVNVKGQSISTIHSSRAQKGARELIKLFVPEVSENEVMTWAVRLSKKNRKTITPKLNNADFAKNFAILLKVFDQLSNFILGGQEWPLKIDLKGVGLPYEQLLIAGEFMDSFTHNNPFKPGYWALKDGRIRKYKEFMDELIDLDKHQKRVMAASLREFLDRHKSKSDPNVYVAQESIIRAYCNTAVYAFCLAIVADSGANFSVLTTLDWEESENIKSINKMRVVGRKLRANGKTQDICVSPRFQPYFRKFLKLRKYMGCDGKKGTWLFNKNTKKLVPLPVKAEMKDVNRRLFRILKVPIKVPGSREWRWNVSYEYLNASGGDIELVSRVLGNTHDTVRRHYGYGTFENSAIELGDFFNELIEYSKNRARVDDRLIPVAVDHDSPRTLTGGCLAEKSADASLVEGFTAAVTKPDCGIPVTCFLCSFYAIHIDTEDFLKILSAMDWLKMQGGRVSQNHDEYLAKYEPIITRIEEILAQASKIHPMALDAFDAAKKSIAIGAYDPYWKVQIDALIESEAVL